MSESTAYPVGTISANNRDFPVTFDPSRGWFAADVNGRTVGSRDWEDLRARVAAEERRTRVRVEVAFVAPDSGRRGAATGLHASTRKPLIRWADGTRSSADDVREPLSPDVDTAKLAELVAAARDADRALREFRHAHRLSSGYTLTGYTLTSAVEAAIKAKVAELSEVEEGEA